MRRAGDMVVLLFRSGRWVRGWYREVPMTKAYHAEVIENVRICPWPDPYDDREHPNERPEQRKSLSHEAGFSGPEWMQPTEAKSDIERTGQHGFPDSSLSMPIPVDPHSRMDKCGHEQHDAFTE
jgi:hypothetical protein